MFQRRARHVTIGRTERYVLLPRAIRDRSLIMGRGPTKQEGQGVGQALPLPTKIKGGGGRKGLAKLKEGGWLQKVLRYIVVLTRGT